MAKTGSVYIQMEQILDEYSDTVVKATNDAMMKVGKESAQKLRNTSPKRVKGKTAGRYARGWTTKTTRRTNGKIDTVVVHNRTDYQLTHLLENGHAIWNSKDGSRAAPIKHIEPVEEWANDEFVREVESKL